MTQETQIQAVENLLTPLLPEGVFLVSMKVKPVNNIKIYLDADEGLGIEKCIRINRALYKIMEEQGLYPDSDFSLEVSSPGVDEPLKLWRQYKKNLGRNVEVITIEGARFEGKLDSVTEEAVTLSFTEGKGKKAIEKKQEIPFTEIKQTKVMIRF